MIDDDSFLEIKQIFIEEADEGLDIMESGLLELSDGAGGIELVNDIFRAAHSIKGGSATFGFANVSEFTHLMETLLDEIRDESREATPDCIQVLLESVDCLREMMTAVKDDREANDDRSTKVAGQLQQILDSVSEVTSSSSSTMPSPQLSETSESTVTETANRVWTIDFIPNFEILKQGNDPALLFRELRNLGTLKVDAVTDSLPDLAEIDPELCYISWVLTLESECEKEQIEEVFDWVVDDSKLKIELQSENCEESQQKENLEEDANHHEIDTQKDHSPSVANPAKETSASTTSSPSENKPAKKENGSIRVGIDKIDSLLNLVGELVITQSMLKRYGSNDINAELAPDLGDLHDGLAQLEMNARELQDVAMKMRMLPIKTAFARFPRLIHDLSLQLGKKVDLEIVGEHTELDKTVLEKIGDPLVHLVRNGLDHGLETPERRIAAGKPESGNLKLAAWHEAGNIIIQVSDDGAGINNEIILAKARERGLVADDEKLAPEAIPYLIFHPGFSTAATVSDVSGRGVGMDVVKRNIQDLGGRVEVKSEYGRGSTFTIRLPLTLAILDGQLVRIEDDVYTVPLLSIVETVVVDETRLNMMAAQSTVYRLRNEYIPVINMVDALGLSGESKSLAEPLSIVGKLLVIVESAGKIVGLVVDDLLDQQQVVLKSLDANYQQIKGLAGATILGDGAVSLIIDIPSLVESWFGDANPQLITSKKAA